MCVCILPLLAVGSGSLACDLSCSVDGLPGFILKLSSLLGHWLGSLHVLDALT